MTDGLKITTVSAPEEAQMLARMQWETSALVAEFAKPGEITKDMPGTQLAITNPGLADTLLASVERLGHRDKFPRPYDWENLIPQLEAGEELLWMVEKKNGKCSIHIGIKFGLDAPERRISIDEPGLRHKRLAVLCDSLARRSFPESEISLLNAQSVVEKLEKASKDWGRQVTCVAGVPSPKELDGDQMIADRDEETRPFASLNDVMETLLEEEDFAVVFSVARASAQEIAAQFRTKAELRNQVRPWIKREVGKNWAHTDETGEQTGTNLSQNTTITHQRDMFTTIFQGVCGTQGSTKAGVAAGALAGTYLMPGVGTVVGGLAGGALAWWGQEKGMGTPAPSETETVSISETQTKGTSDQSGGSVSVTAADTLMEYLDKSLDESMKHLQMAMGTGGYYGCAMVYAKDRHASRRIGKTLAAVLSGSKSHLRPMQILPFEGEGCMFQLNRNIATHALLAKGGVFLEILDCEQAERVLLLPDAELPGLEMRRSVFYGRPDMKTGGTGGTSIEIGTLAFARKTIVNELDSGAADSASIELTKRGSFALTPEELRSHLLLVGTTGSGKTVRAAAILNRIPPADFRIIVLETAKKTYRDLLRRDGKAPCVFTLGDSRHQPFRFNPFYFDPGTSMKQHISVLADAMAELLPTEALIAPKLREASELCYRQCGWDIESGRFLGSGPPPVP